MIGQNAITWLAALLLASPQPAADARGPAAPATRYTIVVTGSELLSGVYADGHTYFLTRTLRPLGLHCVGAMCVDDNRADLKEALRFAAGKASPGGSARPTAISRARPSRTSRGSRWRSTLTC